MSLWLRADARTGAGELRMVTLPDGSRAHLCAGSALALHYGGDRRRVALLAGEALFEVEPDPSRPFVVEAAGGEILARGTAFDVATSDARTEVTVTEHAVDVTGAGASVRVEAGSQTAYGPGLPALESYPVDPEKVTAWRRGRLYFNDKPLGEVIAALARYHRGLCAHRRPRATRPPRDRRLPHRPAARGAARDREIAGAEIDKALRLSDPAAFVMECEERSDEAIQCRPAALDCFVRSQ